MDTVTDNRTLYSTRRSDVLESTSVKNENTIKEISVFQSVLQKIQKHFEHVFNLYSTTAEVSANALRAIAVFHWLIPLSILY